MKRSTTILAFVVSPRPRLLPCQPHHHTNSISSSGSKEGVDRGDGGGWSEERQGAKGGAGEGEGGDTKGGAEEDDVDEDDDDEGNESDYV